MSIDFFIKKEYRGKKIKLPYLKEPECVDNRDIELDIPNNAHYLFIVVFEPDDVDELERLGIKPGEGIQEPELIYLNEKKESISMQFLKGFDAYSLYRRLELIFEKCY